MICEFEAKRRSDNEVLAALSGACAQGATSDALPPHVLLIRNAIGHYRSSIRLPGALPFDALGGRKSVPRQRNEHATFQFQSHVEPSQ